MNDFAIPVNNERKKATKPSLAQTPIIEPTEEIVEEVVNTEKEESEKPRYDQTELLAIFDEIIFSGEYTEEVVIKNKLRVNFRTRSAGEIEEITRTVDTLQANLVTTLNEKRSILNLQYALTHYQGKDLKGIKTEDRAKFIKSLPGPVIGALFLALQKFDEKVFEACQEGEENF